MTREEQRAKAAHEYIQGDSVVAGNEVLAFGDFINGAKWADFHPHWIPVEEGLPEENGKTQQSISVWATNGLMSSEFRYNFDTKTWTDMWGDPFDITHWMPCPKPPEKEEEQ